MKIKMPLKTSQNSLLRILALGLIAGGGFLGMFPSASAAGGGKTFWHFTLQAKIDGNKAEEWLWATMVEMSKEEVNPELAGIVKAAGGAIPGTVLAHSRAAAWRSDFTYLKDRKCKRRPSKIKCSWRASWGNFVYAHGQVQGPARDRMNQLSLFNFRFGLCDGLVLLEDGQRVDIADLVNPIVGPVYHGNEREQMPEKIRVRGIVYEDLLIHYAHCGRTWSEQAVTPLMHYARENLHAGFMDQPDRGSGVQWFRFHGHDIDVYWRIVRSSSRDHPDWKQKR